MKHYHLFFLLLSLYSHAALIKIKNNSGRQVHVWIYDGDHCLNKRTITLNINGRTIYGSGWRTITKIIWNYTGETNNAGKQQYYAFDQFQIGKLSIFCSFTILASNHFEYKRGTFDHSPQGQFLGSTRLPPETTLYTYKKGDQISMQDYE